LRAVAQRRTGGGRSRDCARGRAIEAVEAVAGTRKITLAGAPLADGVEIWRVLGVPRGGRLCLDVGGSHGRDRIEVIVKREGQERPGG
jgi:hypothetical protein